MDLETARQIQSSYRPNDDITAQLATSTALLIVGPAAIGKSSILDTIAKLDSRFSRTGSISTRPQYARDQPGMHSHYSQKALLEKIAARTLVQYAIHPTTQYIYATTPDMYKSPFNMLETLPVAADYFHHLSFHKLFIFYIVTEPLVWKEWFEARYHDDDTEYRKRAREATTNLEWALEQPDSSLIWVRNSPDAQQETARQIIRAVDTDKPLPNHRPLAVGMLEIAKKLSSDSI